MTRSERGAAAFRAGIALAALTSLGIVWTTIVRDDGSASGSFMLIMAAGVGSFATSLRAQGMARTMAGVAAMQCALGALTATAPVITAVPGESVRALTFSGGFALLWLCSAALFRAAARSGSERLPG